tara:strand:+ start:569 stop:1234 length:666 start_codon:yes stop_codon:yes gene_type:complete
MKKIQNQRQYQHIIWDWNGTLLNDGWLFVDIMNSILIKRAMTPITLEKYREIFTFPVKNYYITLGFDLEKEPFEKCGLEFIKEYKKRRYEAQLYPNVDSILERLLNIGITNSILSAQHQILLNDLTKYYNVQNYFNKIIGLDNHYADSKINNGINFINKVNIDPNNILLIGDTCHDYETAQKMGIDCILISNGHNSKARLKKTGGIIFNDINDFAKFFKLY